MLKRLALKYWPMLLFVLLIVAILCMSRYAENREAENPNNGRVSSPQATISPRDAGQGTQNANKPWHYPSWVDIFTWPEGATVWALFLTLLVIAWQSTETRAAAQSAERQIALQSVAMRQWVNIEPIKTVTPPTFENPVEVTLEFQVLNKTDYLLTVKKIEAEVFYWGKARIFKVSGSDPVPPEKSSADGGLPFFLTLLVDRSKWPDSGALFFVGGEITYLDCMDIERTQEFRDLFHGYENGRLVRKKPSGQVPEIADYKAEYEETKTNDPEHAWFSWAMRKLK
jgi:hypothetical protein